VQIQSHGNLILRLYGQARGQAAEFWGEDYLESDRWVQTMEIPNRANAWYESQNPIFCNYLDAFVGGMNAYAKEHPKALTEKLKVALPPQTCRCIGRRAMRHQFYFYSRARVP
jgi:acyl-homoserine-lactone acylase